MNMRPILAAACLAAAGLASADVAWKWDTTQHPADVIVEKTEALGATFESFGPRVVEKTGGASAFGIYTGLFLSALTSSGISVDGTAAGLMLLLK